MPIESLSIDQFRNLQPVQLQLSPQLNLFIGDNAAGKTSVLESLYVLARGRSFRARQLDKLVKNGADGFRLVALVKEGDGRSVPVGMQRSGSRLVCRIDGQPVKRLSELAALFPVQWIGGNLHAVIEDGPVNRRQFLDWGLFHVKPAYIVTWKRFQKLLKQRNAVLRKHGGIREIQAWDSELAAAGEQLDCFRRDYLAVLLPEIDALGGQFTVFEHSVAVNYRRGWADDKSYAEILSAGLEKDRESGFTQSGPQRAELAFGYNDKLARERLSRGQQKVYVIALHLAQATLLFKQTGKKSLFLFDDLSAELDIENQSKVMSLLTVIQAQVFVTSISDIDFFDSPPGAVKRFHVKHGLVTEVV